MLAKIPYTFKKVMITLTAVSLFVIPIGCSKASKDQSQVPSATQHSNTPIKEQQDQDLTKKLTSENGVQSGKVYLSGNEAIATITIKKGTVEKTIKDLATKYANTMKQKYSDKKIHVVAFMENKEIANISL